jgi:alpha-tubulin suppressor-like RCC1 family protein
MLSCGAMKYALRIVAGMGWFVVAVAAGCGSATLKQDGGMDAGGGTAGARGGSGGAGATGQGTGGMAGAAGQGTAGAGGIGGAVGSAGRGGNGGSTSSGLGGAGGLSGSGGGGVAGSGGSGSGGAGGSGASCMIGGTTYADGAANPANACQTCQISFAATSWTTAANGASCGTGQVCSSGTCQTGCWIGGALIGSGATNSTNVCQICKPASSTTTWSSNSDGTSCGNGQICDSGSCQAACYVGGTVYATGMLNPANSCQSCLPLVSTSAWSQAQSDCATIAAHNTFTCATVGGAAKCWGSNGFDSGGRGTSYSGLLGINQTFAQTPYSLVPVATSGLGTGVQAVSTGSDSLHGCALVSGAVECWGYGAFGQIGDGFMSDRNAPVQVSGLTSGVRGVATGDSHSCALLNGQIQCWGDNASGKLGVNPAAISGSPTPVTPAVNGSIQAIAVGGNHTCALVSGSVLCWGFNLFGRLGNNSTMDSYSPVQPVGLGSNVQAIAAGETHTCAIVSGALLCWGSNVFGQLGDGTGMDRWVPTPVQGLSSGVQAVSAGDSHTCAVVNGAAFCWGWNGLGQVGDNTTGTNRLSPVPVQGLSSGVQAISAGYNHSCALTSAGAKCWGANGTGELGNNSMVDSPVPVSVQGL